MAEKKIENAIDLHNVQSTLFQDRYALFQDDPYQTTFTYGRKKADEIISPVLAACSPPKDVLDVGCGTGYTIKVLSSMGYNCIGVDAAEDMLSIARRENPDIRFESADATALPFEDNSFDMVISIEVLRYIQNREKSVEEIYRVLKPGGVCIVTVAPLFSTHGYALFNRLMKILPIPGFSHVKQYFETIGSSTRMFRAAGFDEIQVPGCFFGPFIWLSRILPKSVMSKILRGWEPLDNSLAKMRFLHNFTNHLIVIARKASE